MRVMVVDNHSLIRQGLRCVLSELSGIKVVSEAACGEDAMDQAAQARPDVVILDVQLPGIDGITTCRRLRKVHPSLRLMILTRFASVNLQRRAFEAGATAFVTKGSHHDVLVKALAMLAAGGSFIDPRVDAASGLTCREAEVMACLAHGGTAVEVAKALELSYHTVQDHIDSAKAKLCAVSRNAAISEVTRSGLVEAYKWPRRAIRPESIEPDPEISG